MMKNPPADVRFELHISTTPSFTPDSTTLVAVGKDQAFEVGNLDPAKTQYAKIVPIVSSGPQLIRGQPSAEISFTPGRALATHLNSDVEWGRLPLNGGFETQLDPADPPDFWTMGGGTFGTWGVNGNVLSDADGISGANYLQLKSSTSIIGGTVLSAFFNINENLWYAPSVWRKAISGSNSVTMALLTYDKDHNLLSATPNETFALNTSVGSWVQYRFAAVQAGSGARFAQFQIINPGGTGPFQECHFDDIRLEDDERWHDVGASGEPAFANSWVNFGSSHPGAGFMRTRNGEVVLRGLVKSGTFGTSIFTLPTGYRPASNEDYYQIVESNDGVGIVWVLSSGLVRAQAGNNTHFSLNGVRFRP